MTRIYLIGSLRNSRVPEVAAELRQAGHDVFDDWYSAGPEADDYWRDYEKNRGRSYKEALAGKAAKHVFEFDRDNLVESAVAVLVAPAGKSAHMELGFMAGKGRDTYVLFDDEPERWDIMYQFATGVCTSVEDLLKELDNGKRDH